jgi:DNA-binding transcriptional ArsR family regulator
MDALITAAARALAAGDPISALKRVALRTDAPGLALRGLAMAQLGDLNLAAELLRSAARTFGSREPLAQARCVVALAEIALVSRNLNWPTVALDTARGTLERHGDRLNAAHACLLQGRRLLLLGRVDEGERAMAALDVSALPETLQAMYELVVATIALRRVRTQAARSAFLRAEQAASRARIKSLQVEVLQAASVLSKPAARLIRSGEARPVRLDEVENVLASGAVIVDACRSVVRKGDHLIPLAGRPVLFELARVMAEAWPEDVPRHVLVERAFGTRLVDESYRSRLRVEVGRLRAVLGAMVGVTATRRGFTLVPTGSEEIVVLAQPVDEKHAEVLACLADGESWSSSALALALGSSQRTVQRALDALAREGKAESIGAGRSRRWISATTPGFATILLLPASPPM